MNFDVRSILPHLKAYSEPRDEAAAVRTSHGVSVNRISFTEGIARLELSERGKDRGVKFVISISHAGLLMLLGGLNDSMAEKLTQATMDNEAAKVILEELADGLLALADEKKVSRKAAVGLLGGHDDRGYMFAPHAIAVARERLAKG